MTAHDCQTPFSTALVSTAASRDPISSSFLTVVSVLSPSIYRAVNVLKRNEGRSSCAGEDFLSSFILELRLSYLKSIKAIIEYPRLAHEPKGSNDQDSESRDPSSRFGEINAENPETRQYHHINLDDNRQWLPCTVHVYHTSKTRTIHSFDSRKSHANVIRQGMNDVEIYRWMKMNEGRHIVIIPVALDGPVGGTKTLR